MKKLVVIVLVIVLSLSLFAGCSNNDDKEQTLVVYTEAGFPPFEYYEGDKVVGVDVDIANAIGEKLGYKVIINDVPFDTICASVAKEDNALGIAGLTIDEERLKTVDFTQHYFTSKQAVIFKKGTITKPSSGLMSLTVLDGKKIGVQTGTSGDFLVSDYEPATSKGYENALVATMDIGKGCDYVVIDSVVAKNIVAKHTDLEYFELDSEPEQYGIAVMKGNEKLLKEVEGALEELIKSGKIDEFLVNHSVA